MEMQFNNMVFKVHEGCTTLAEIDCEEFAQDPDETIDEVMLRALRALQWQLKGQVADHEIDSLVVQAIPYLSDIFRPKKKTTTGYRAITFPH